MSTTNIGTTVDAMTTTINNNNVTQEQVETAIIAAGGEIVTEAQLQEVAEEAAPGVDPLDKAAHMFMTSIPRIKALSSNMKRNSLARVFKAVVEFPLAENYPSFKDKTESELFVLTLSAISAKNVMTASFTGKQKEEIVQEATNGIVQELLNEEKANG